MKQLTILIFLFTIISFASAQKVNAVHTMLKNNCEHVHLFFKNNKTKNTSRKTYPFSTIDVVDYRPDSSRSGLFVLSRQQYDFVFKTSASSAISTFLNDDFTNAQASKTLLVVIKKFWCADIVYGKHTGERRKQMKSQIVFQADTYTRESNGYTPLARFDTLITSDRPIMDMVYFRLPALMDAFMEKINGLYINSASMINKRLLSYAFIDSFSNRNFLHPIDTAKILPTGVYASFEDFKNNKPSISNYSIEKEATSSMALFLKDGQGASYYSRTMWGFCDGQQRYVMMDGNLFPVFTVNRAYYIYGSKEYMVTKSSVPIYLLFPPLLVTGSVPISEKVTRKMRFFMLDMQSGNIY